MNARLLDLIGRYIAIRSRSIAEFRRYLQKKSAQFGLDEVRIEELIEKYHRAGLVSDEQFAESVSHQLVSYKSKGPLHIAQTLKMAGVSKELTSATLASLDPEGLTQAMEHRLKRYEKKLAALEPRERRWKALSYLHAAGFPSSLSSGFVDEWMRKGYNGAHFEESKGY